MHKSKIKQYGQIMFYNIDEYVEELVLQSKFVNCIPAWYYKFNKHYKRKFYCKERENVFENLVQKRQETCECPYCEL